MPTEIRAAESGRNDQQHRVAACQVVEDRVDGDEWSERKVNLPGIGSVPMIAAMSNSIDDGRRQVLDCNGQVGM